MRGTPLNVAVLVLALLPMTASVAYIKQYLLYSQVRLDFVCGAFTTVARCAGLVAIPVLPPLLTLAALALCVPLLGRGRSGLGLAVAGTAFVAAWLIAFGLLLANA